jgi:hypothetical protein
VAAAGLEDRVELRDLRVEELTDEGRLVPVHARKPG